MATVIERRVGLGFLGEKYESSYITFKSISIKELDQLQDTVKELQKDETKALPFIVEQLKSRFIDGEIDGSKIAADEVEELPADVVIECFKRMQGNIDPKV